jgi:hypothetical protein
MQDENQIFTDKEFWGIGLFLLVLVIAGIALSLS